LGRPAREKERKRDERNECSEVDVSFDALGVVGKKTIPKLTKDFPTLAEEMGRESNVFGAGY